MGFSLLELLVVVGVIAVLAGVLLPVMSKARASARDTLCLAQLREVGTLAHVRANDHRGYLSLAGDVVLPLDDSASPPGDVPDELPRALNDPHRTRYAYLTNFRTFEESFGRHAPHRETVVPFLIDLVRHASADYRDIVPRLGGYVDDPHKGLMALLRCPRMPPDQLNHLRDPLVKDADVSAEERADAYGGTHPLMVLYRDRTMETEEGYAFAGGYVFDLPAWWPHLDYAANAGLLSFDFRPGAETRAYRGLVSKARGASTFVLMGDHSGNTAVTSWKPALDPRLGPTVTLRDQFQRTEQMASHIGVAGHHAGRVNLLLVDGHAEAVPVTSDALERFRLLGQ